MKLQTYDQLDRIVAEAVKKKRLHGAVFRITAGDSDFSWSGAAGNLDVNSRYYIASINKLFISSIVLRLISEGRLSFDDHLSRFLPEQTLQGLHVYKGTDYSPEITIRHLLSQTSGLPGYLTDKPAEGQSAIKELEEGIDQAWPTARVIERVKAMEAHFPPGEGNKAKYIDTNHQLLNLVIESVTGESVRTVLAQLFTELNLRDTYVCEDVSDTSYVFPYYKDRQLDISRFVSSTDNDIVSTASDQMQFIRAFFEGRFYPKEELGNLMVWKSIFFPFQYGIGLQRFHMPRMMSPFSAVPDMVGHSGSTGSVAFFVPDRNLYITGTTNQQDNPASAFQTTIRIVNALR